jgi:hypothetical protein
MPEPEAQAKPEPKPLPEPEAEQPPKPEPAPESEREPEPEPEPAPPQERVLDPATSEGAGRFLERIGQTESLTHRFRTLRQEIDLARGLSPEQLEQLLGSFRPGWEKRRALAALFRAGLPDSIAQATGLIENLESPISRRWCARMLLNERELSDSEREALDRLAQ